MAIGLDPVSGNLLFYSSVEPLSRDVHGSLGVRQMEKPFAFAAAAYNLVRLPKLMAASP